MTTLFITLFYHTAFFFQERPWWRRGGGGTGRPTPARARLAVPRRHGLYPWAPGPGACITYNISCCMGWVVWVSRSGAGGWSFFGLPVWSPGPTASRSDPGLLIRFPGLNPVFRDRTDPGSPGRAWVRVRREGGGGWRKGRTCDSAGSEFDCQPTPSLINFFSHLTCTCHIRSHRVALLAETQPTQHEYCLDLWWMGEPQCLVLFG